MKDRFGLGWRPELAAGILSNLDRIDFIEVIADDYFDASKAKRRALRTLATHVPVALHGIALGLASSTPVETKRLENTARLVDEIHPQFWSEHLAFVRAGGIEIGHLAAPPRTAATIDGAANNLASAKAVVGAAPLMENVASLIDPPGSAFTESEWIRQILVASDCNLLLDLHNLHANSVNFGYDPQTFLERIPPERISAIHLAGGRWIKAKTTDERRLLDDHLHDVPEAVYHLLEYIGATTSHPLTVILERDGRYPPIAALLKQLERSRHALQHGRAKRHTKVASEAA